LRRIRWAPAAANDLEGIRNFLEEHHPSFTQSTIRRLYNAARSLKQFPHRGRIGQKEGTRELVILPLPYVIVYRVDSNILHILRLMHTSEDWL
jgi:addiction module RelE/StbE family toxin